MNNPQDTKPLDPQVEIRRIYYCPQCRKEMTFNYHSDKVLDLNDTDFLDGWDVTATTTLSDLKTIEMQDSTILYCEDCQIDVVVSMSSLAVLPYQDKPPIEETEPDPNSPWKDFTTPTLISKLHDKLFLGGGSSISKEVLADCQEIVCAIMERQDEESIPPKEICSNNSDGKRHEYQWQDYCGAKVCIHCGDHKGLARCYCGWGLAPGERLEDDVEY